MRKIAVIAASAVVLFSAAAYLVKSTPSDATQASEITAFELMSQAKDLPVAPHVDAF